ncbi:uncharacterized protein METZ01_LOCUS99816 [marine metagenome]|uniref:Uncharacterized protein n=1 Tax=marine metagenome TaxID=408172 RepID=A0A381W3A2_9ZZZZ
MIDQEDLQHKDTNGELQHNTPAHPIVPPFFDPFSSR